MQKAFIILFIAFSLGCTSTSNSSNIPERVVKEPGIYPSPDGICEATLTVNAMGGFLTLSVSSELNQRIGQDIDDITGMFWLNVENLILTVSPIYGHPGIYIVNCKTMRVSRILGPRTINDAYPEGADYFELEGVSDVIYFYYSPDVDSTDFRNFRTRDFLYKINMNGEGFQKVRD